MEKETMIDRLNFIFNEEGKPLTTKEIQECLIKEYPELNYDIYFDSLRSQISNLVKKGLISKSKQIGQKSKYYLAYDSVSN